MRSCPTPKSQKHDAGCGQVRSVRTQGTIFLQQSLTGQGILTPLLVTFADLSEYGYDVAIMSESKHGLSCQGNVLRILLLHGATAPDAEQDQGSSYVSPLLWDDGESR